MPIDSARGLAEHAKVAGVEFHFRTEVTGLAMRGGHISAVVTERGRFEADQYVVAAGSYSTPLLATVGLPLPVRPVKGYSITFDNPGNRCPLAMPIADYCAARRGYSVSGRHSRCRNRRVRGLRPPTESSTHPQSLGSGAEDPAAGAARACDCKALVRLTCDVSGWRADHWADPSLEPIREYGPRAPGMDNDGRVRAASY